MVLTKWILSWWVFAVGIPEVNESERGTLWRLAIVMNIAVAGGQNADRCG